METGRLQQLGQAQRLFEKKFGGTFCGLYASSTGITWQPDTMYIFYKGSDRPLARRKPQGSMLVSVACRDGGILVKTQPQSTINLLGPPDGSAAWGDSWLTKWKDDEVCRSFVDLRQLRYFVLSAPGLDKLAIIDRKDAPDKWIQFKPGAGVLGFMFPQSGPIDFLTTSPNKGVCFFNKMGVHFAIASLG